MNTLFRLGLGVLLFVVIQDVAGGRSVSRVPFVKQGNRIVVSATLGNTESLSFAVDTGTTYTMIDSRVARDYGLTEGKVRKVSVLGRHVNVYETRLPRICFGRTCFESLEARICDLSRFSNLDGLLGLEAFRETGLTLDFSTKQLLFHPTEELASSQRFVGVLPFVPIRVQCGDQTVVLMLDSAGIELILFEQRVRDLVKLNRTGTNKTVLAAGASFETEEILMPEFSIGHLKLTGKVAFLWAEPTHRRIQGVLGVSGLGLKQLSLDFKNNRISWE